MPVPWLIYNSKGFCIGPFCRDCFYFSRDRRSPLYQDFEIYDCFSCPYACHIWSNGKRWTCSSSYSCSHFKPRTINKDFFAPNEIIGEQLTLF